MVTLAGIDEAGLGPVLGPLVVSSTAFSVRDIDVERSLWATLASAVSRRPPRRPSRIAIADSKALYGGLGTGDLAQLERGVLAMLALTGPRPTSLRALVERLCPDAAARMETYPWYAGADRPLPRAVAADDPVWTADALDRALRRGDVRVVGISSRIVFAGDLNRGLAGGANKADVEFVEVVRLLREIRDGGLRPSRIHVDRLGGRRRYLELLRRAFPDETVTCLAEGRRISRYRLDGAEVWFAVAAERQQLPVALASMTSKYLRELFMELLNDFWSRQRPGLRPTAGYYGDGRRFRRDVAPLLRQHGWDDGLLFRRR